MVYRRTSSTTPTSVDERDSTYTSSDVYATVVQPEPPSPTTSQEPMSRKCDVEECGKIYTGKDSANSLARHKREKHSDRSFTCPITFCGHAPHRLHNLRAHWEAKHKGMAMPSWLAATQTRGGGGVKRKKGGSATE
jgi:hypothetical protein